MTEHNNKNHHISNAVFKKYAPLALFALGVSAFCVQFLVGTIGALLAYMSPLPLYIGVRAQSLSRSVIATLLCALPLLWLHPAMWMVFIIAVAMPVLNIHMLCERTNTLSGATENQQKNDLWDLWQGRNQYPIGTLLSMLAIISAMSMLLLTLIYEPNLPELYSKISTAITPVITEIYADFDQNTLNYLTKTLPLSIPIFLCVFLFLIHVINAIAAHRIITKNAQQLIISKRHFEPFKTLKLPTAFIYFSAALMLISVLSWVSNTGTLSEEQSNHIATLPTNWITYGAEFFLATALATWFIAGLAVLHALTEQITQKTVVRIVCYTGILVYPPIGLGIILLALTDAILNLRKTLPPTK